MKTLVIIVTWNGMQWVDRCLGSVFSSKAPADAFVADNSSSDGTADYIASKYPAAHLVRNSSNLGFAEANNQGFRYAMENGYDYVYLLNQDAWIGPDTLGTIIEVHAAHPEFGILSPEQMQIDGVSYNPVFEREVIPSEKPVDAAMGLYEVPFIMAAHWLLPVSTLRKAGFFAEMFPIYGNDDEYCNRVLYKGLKLGVVMGVKVVHDKQYSPQTIEQKVYRNYYMGSLVSLVDVRKPYALQMAYVVAHTLVKVVRYRSFLPFSYFWKILGKKDRLAVGNLRKELRK